MGYQIKQAPMHWVRRRNAYWILVVHLFERNSKKGERITLKRNVCKRVLVMAYINL
jgi:hypothetical protein